MRVLRASVDVHLRDKEGHVTGTVTYGPGDSPPEDVAALITNPKCWADPPAEGGEPNRAGRGASRHLWAEYADSIGVEFPEGANRDEIIAAVDAAK